MLWPLGGNTAGGMSTHLRTLDGWRHPASCRDMVVLDHDHVKQPHPVVGAAANEDRPLVGHPQARHCLARLQHFRARALQPGACSLQRGGSDTAVTQNCQQ